MDAIKILEELNNSSKPFRIQERTVGDNKKVIDFYGKTPECIKYLKEYLGLNSPEDIIPNYFISQKMKDDSMNGNYYVFSIKLDGLTKNQLRMSSDSRVIRAFKKAKIDLIESQCNPIFDSIKVGWIYYVKSRTYGIVIFRVTDIFDNVHVSAKLLRFDEDLSKLGKSVNLYINKDNSIIIEWF